MILTEDDIKKRILALPVQDRNGLLFAVCTALYGVEVGASLRFDTEKMWSSDEIEDIGNAVASTLNLTP